jgi:pyruvate dehydrogenase E1 component beta subunit
VRRGGVGAEVAALVTEELWGTLAAPVLRVTGKNTPVPYAAELEAFHLPAVSDIVDAVRTVIK